MYTVNFGVDFKQLTILHDIDSRCGESKITNLRRHWLDLSERSGPAGYSANRIANDFNIISGGSDTVT